MKDTQLQRILYVEDEPDIRQIAQLALEAVGRFDNKVCASGEEAVRAFPVARYGGEEFAVLLPGADGSSPRGVLDRLRADFAAIHYQNDRDESFNVTLSVGLAALPAYRTGRDLLLAADRALYESKAHGRNHVTLSS